MDCEHIEDEILALLAELRILHMMLKNYFVQKILMYNITFQHHVQYSQYHVQ